MNSGAPWTEDDISLLSEMFAAGLSLRTIARALGRTQRAVLNAQRNIIYQQLARHDPEDVAANYNMTIQALENDIVPSKYYVPLQDAEDADAEDADAGAGAEPKPDAETDGSVFLGLALIVGVPLILAGAAQYGSLLRCGW